MSPKASWILQEEVIPRLRAVIPRSVRCVGSEDAEELIQDATVMAARMIIAAEKNQKKFGGSNIAITRFSISKADGEPTAPTRLMCWPQPPS